ncbi:MAG: prepilin peptidase [Phycisphaerales bacterium]|nr:prepilin peptidase [Phycisphaerales bacterium]
MLWEVLFLAPCLLLGAVGYWLTGPDGPFDAVRPHLWVAAFAGSALGYLVGGAAVWGIRIFGSLAFGKEAMGLGDVHLMAAVGAVLGWMDPLLAFFVAPFLGIAWAVGSVFTRTLFKREGSAMPYGPHLAAATVLVVLFKPGFEAVLSAIFQRAINLP